MDYQKFLKMTVIRRGLLFPLFFLSVFTSAQTVKSVELTKTKKWVIYQGQRFYTDFYRFNNKADTALLSLKRRANGDIGHVSHIYLYYEFKPSIPDDVYQITINGKPIEKITFKNGKKNGLYCDYEFKPTRYRLLNYHNNKVIDYFLLDTAGHILEYSPCLDELPFKGDHAFLYRFTPSGLLNGIVYSFRAHKATVVEQFEHGRLAEVNLHGTLADSVKHSGLLKGDYLYGERITSAGAENYSFYYKEGVLTKFRYWRKEPFLFRSHINPSDAILDRGSELLEFCEQ